ncbi:unnamed protein product [Peniophora sp. CBMAI 1063]|nr:unnamed protein product [Peniophora sp. CBMAI 1063]
MHWNVEWPCVRSSESHYPGFGVAVPGKLFVWPLFPIVLTITGEIRSERPSLAEAHENLAMTLFVIACVNPCQMQDRKTGQDYSERGKRNHVGYMAPLARPRFRCGERGTGARRIATQSAGGAYGECCDFRASAGAQSWGFYPGASIPGLASPTAMFPSTGLGRRRSGRNDPGAFLEHK